MKTETIIALNSSPGALAGNCPKCGAELHNPTRQEHIGLSVSLRWEVTCGGCGAKILIENPRFLFA